MSRFSVDTHLFRELGRLLVGRDSTALVELIKNAYDADATEVVVHGERLASNGAGLIVISDNGNGMTEDLFTAGFLTIASRSKELGDRRSLRFKRRFTGAKGVGRLAAHKLAEAIEIHSFPRPEIQRQTGDRAGVYALIDWKKIEEFETLDSVPNTAIKVKKLPAAEAGFGTRIRLLRLRKRWSETLRHTFLREVETFLVPESLLRNPSNYLSAPPLFASPVVSDTASRTQKPFKVNFTGELEVGEDQFVDVVSTADWIIEVLSEPNTKHYSISIQPTAKTTAKHSDATGKVFRLARPENAPAFQARIYSRWGKAWAKGGIRIYQEGFRVLPYGESNNDWLELDAVYKQRDRRLRFLDKVGVSSESASTDEGLSSIGNKGFFGAVFLTVEGAPDLEMLVNREGFVPSESFDAMRLMVQAAIQLNVRERARITLREKAKPPTKTQPKNSAARTLLDAISRALEQAGEIKSLRIDAPVRSKIEGMEEAIAEAQEVAVAVLSEATNFRLLAAIGLQLSAFLHEVRGLLVHVRELEERASALKDKLSGGDRTAAAKLLTRISDFRRAIERQTAYLEDVASADSRRRRSRQKISGALDSVVSLYGPEMIAKDVEFRNRIDEELKTPIPMFSAELVLILSNLISNALKAVQPGGRIESRARASTSGFSIELSNTGKAVNLKTAERWFLPFESTSGDAQPLLGKGMGLGLTIVRELLEDYNVTVSFIAPPPGMATTVRVLFPNER